MKYVVWLLLIGLVVLHQDYWQWEKASLVFGFLPWSLAWHAGLSLAAAAVWYLALRFCWPERAEATPPALRESRR